MKSALLAFHLGPVQPFIAQARKARDLWIGSYLLSTLMRAGLRDYPGRLLYHTAPTENRGDPIADLPNKFVALHPSLDDAHAGAEHMRKRIRDAWTDLADPVWRKVFDQEQDTGLRAIWDRQIDPETLFEIYWAIVPYDEQNKSAYGTTYQRAQRLLDARKRLRNFAPATELGEKSTVSGERQALAPTATATRLFWIGLAERFQDAQLSRLGHERLDAIDTIKRFGAYANTVVHDRSFPSTDTLAAAPFLAKLIQRLQQPDAPPSLSAAVETLFACTQDEGRPFYFSRPNAVPGLSRLARNALSRSVLKHDGEAFYGGSFTHERLKDVGVDAASADDLAKRGAAAVKALRREARENGIAPPSSYYAVILLDGDGMGKLLSTLSSPKAHGDLSAALSKFAHDAPRRIVEGEKDKDNDKDQDEDKDEGKNKGLGRVVYAGGDDVMAFLPVTDALAAACDLRKAYGEALQQIARDATASAGIVFAHRLTPLRMALQAAHEAEVAAKESYHRNALCVSLLRRSGAITSVGAHWTYGTAETAEISTDGRLDPLALVGAVRQHLFAGGLSPMFVYTLMEEAPTLVALEQAARMYEIERLLRRQWAGPLTESAIDEIKRLAGDLATLAGAVDQDLRANGQADKAGWELTEAGPRQGMVEVSGWLLIAAFLARSDKGGDQD